MALDDAMSAYKVTVAEARMVPTIILKARERRQRRCVESAPEVDHAALGRLAALGDELTARGVVPPELRTAMAPRHREATT